LLSVITSPDRLHYPESLHNTLEMTSYPDSNTGTLDKIYISRQRAVT